MVSNRPDTATEARTDFFLHFTFVMRGNVITMISIGVKGRIKVDVNSPKSLVVLAAR